MTMVRRIGAAGLLVSVGIGVPAYAQNTTTRVSVTNGGAQANGASLGASLSDDGRYVVFVSEATNLVSGDTSTRQDVFVRDRQLGVTERVSVGAGGVAGLGGLSREPSISDDGRHRGILVERDQSRRGRHERRIGCLRAQSADEHDDPRERDHRRCPGDRRRLRQARHQRRRPLRRLHVDATNL